MSSRPSGEASLPDGGAIDPAASSPDVVQRLLRVIREHLDLDVAFIGQFTEGQRVFRFVDAEPGNDAVTVLGCDPIDDSYCGRVAAGRLPRFLQDPRQHPVAAALPVTEQLSIGTYLSVPIRFSDGRTYGTFCCFSTEVKQSLDPRDLRTVAVVAEIAGEYLEALDAAEATQREQRAVIAGVLAEPDALTMVYQPLRDLQTLDIVGIEALARFAGYDEGPEWFFARADEVGLARELEMVAVRTALRALPDIPAPVRLNINASADTLTSGAFFEAVSAVDPGRVVVEVTEHAAVEDYADMKAASGRLQELGILLAIDDVGMGFSGLNRILETSPDELKLDRVVVRDCDSIPTKQALIEAFSSFGRRSGFSVVAEGIETAAELEMLRSLGVAIGQGYHLGRPGPLEALLAEIAAS